MSAGDDLALARACAEALFERDPASRALGMAITRIAASEVEVAMTVRDDMVNGHGTCHGGFIFSLADSAFAFVCNARNRVNVALSCAIDYLRPAREGDRLRAVAVEVQRTGRTGLTEIWVYDQHDEKIARFRGRSYEKNEPIIEDHEP